jgi:hypothetical protein
MKKTLWNSYSSHELYESGDYKNCCHPYVTSYQEPRYKLADIYVPRRIEPPMTSQNFLKKALTHLIEENDEILKLMDFDGEPFSLITEPIRHVRKKEYEKERKALASKERHDT